MTLSSHVPDPRLITAYAERRDGPFHRLNPWTKVAVVPLLVLAVTASDSPVASGVVYAAVLAAYAAAGLPVGRLLRWYTLPVTFVATIVGPLAFGVPGTPLFAVPTPLGTLSLSVDGVVLFVDLACRALAVATYMLTFSMTTGYNELAYLLGRTLPSPLDQVALLTYRFTFVMLETVEELLVAVRGRGGSLAGGFRRNRRLYARVVGMTFLVALERSERLVTSMEARGYDGDITLYARVGRPPASELLAVGVLACGTLAYALVAEGVVVP